MSVDTAAESSRFEAVQEPGYANIWRVVVAATGETIADVRVSADAAGWAARIAEALNAHAREACDRSPEKKEG